MGRPRPSFLIILYNFTTKDHQPALHPGRGLLKLTTPQNISMSLKFTRIQVSSTNIHWIPISLVSGNIDTNETVLPLRRFYAPYKVLLCQKKETQHVLEECYKWIIVVSTFWLLFLKVLLGRQMYSCTKSTFITK